MVSYLSLFTFPFAGGNARSYEGLADCLPAEIKVKPVELPGRGRRFSESLVQDMNELIELLFHELSEQLNQPFAFFGHSMGSIISFLLAHRCRDAGHEQPRAIFVSGRFPPCVPSPFEPKFDLPHDQFVDMLKSLGASPPAVLNEPRIMMLFEPILRADFQLIETWTYEPRKPLDIPIHVLTGERDPLGTIRTEEWSKETTGHFSITSFPGDHFYLFDSWPAIAALIESKVKNR